MKILYSTVLAVCLTASLCASENYQAAYEAGQKASQEQKFEEAVQYFGEAEKLGGTAVEKYNAMMNKVTNLYHLQRWNDAVITCQQVLTMPDLPTPQANEAKYAMVITYIRGNKRKEVLPLLLTLANDSSMSPNQRADLAVNAGDELRSQGKIDEAITVYKIPELLPDINPNYMVQINLGLSYCYQSQQDYAGELKYAQRALNYKADETLAAAAMLRLGEAYMAGKLFDDAAKVLQNLINDAEKPLHYRVMALNNIGSIQNTLKKYDEAIAAYQSILKMPNLSDFHKGIAYMGLTYNYLALKKYAEANAAAEKSKELKELPPWMIFSIGYNQAMILEGTQRFQEAVVAYSRLLASPGFAQAQYDQINLVIGNIYLYRLKDPTKAKEFYQQAAAGNTDWIKKHADAALDKIKKAENPTQFRQ